VIAVPAHMSHENQVPMWIDIHYRTFHPEIMDKFMHNYLVALIYRGTGLLLPGGFQ